MSVTQPRDIDRKRKTAALRSQQGTPTANGSYLSVASSSSHLSSFPHSRRQSMAKLGSPILDSNNKVKSPSLYSSSIHSANNQQIHHHHHHHHHTNVLIDAENPSFQSDSKDEDLITLNTHQYISTDALSSQGGDITHAINKNLIKQQQQEQQDGTTAGPQTLKKARSISDLAELTEGNYRKNSASGLNVPGGFRREFMLTRLKKQKRVLNDEELRKVPFLTRNFIEFLYIYGHFAGEDFQEDFNYSDSLDSDVLVENDENSPLIPKGKTQKLENYEARGTTSTLKAFLIMLKSFIGTGIIFLPKAFSNGGLVFSVVMLLIFGVYSYYCYYILILAKTTAGVSSFGDIGAKLYGSWMKSLILFSLILTQIGFACAYIIFTSENFYAFAKNITGSSTMFKMEYFFILQAVIFIPLSFIRNVSKLSTPSLVANAFIFIGIFIILSFITSHLVQNGVSHPIQLFINSSKFSLFIGTAIFAFEGIGLIIPIQDSMRHPEKFPLVLGLVLITITVLMVSVATIGYLSYGEDIKTAILLNLPQGNILVQSIQFFYSLAILLSTPLQLFPAIAIIQTYVFKLNASSSSSSLDTATSMMAPPPLPLSGKSNPRVKWSKNLLRATMVIICINIAWFGADDLDKFVSFVGCFACIPLVYLYPPLLHLKSVIDGKKLRLERDATSNDEFFEHDEEDDDEEESNARYWRAWIIDGGLVVIGVISMVYNSYQIMFG